jgi:hypothetical protein
MASHDWSKIRFLESTENIKPIVHQSTGRMPSTGIARDIAACLQQGRIFFEIASDAPLQVKPLQIYYGVVGFAKAIILARQVCSISSIAQSHGLSDISEHNSRIEGMTLKFHRNGLFTHFNDTVANLGRISYYDQHSSLRFVPKPFGMAATLAESNCTLKDVLARIPGLERTYERTFGEAPASWLIQFYHDQDGKVQLRLDDPSAFSDRQELRVLVGKWRTKFPFLNDWCFCEATRAWGQSLLIFYNYDQPVQGEFSPEHLIEEDEGFVCRSAPRNILPFETLLPPLAGGITIESMRAIEPLNRVELSEFALHFCGAFLLSSLVRYRPQIWQHALSHSALEGQATDDRALSLIEKFLEIVLGQFPTLVEKSIDWANSHDLRV